MTTEFPSTVSGSDTGSGGADLDKHRSHLFRLAAAEAGRYDGGTIQQANEHTFPILCGQAASVVLTVLKPGGIREPHWHPSAWELNYVVSGEARWSIVEPEGYHDAFAAEAGDLVFLPQGSFHYFENARADQDLTVVIVFNTSAEEPKDDIGIVAALNALPRDVLACVFGAPTGAFDALPPKIKPVTIARRQA